MADIAQSRKYHFSLAVIHLLHVLYLSWSCYSMMSSIACKYKYTSFLDKIKEF